MEIHQIIAGGYQAIELLVAKGTLESHRIEFKQKNDPNSLDLHKDDRRALGEALSGFANAEGGVLIIGISTKHKDGSDRADRIVAIKNVVEVSDVYRSYCLECVAPQIKDLKVFPICNISGDGVIVIEIAKGSARPHMSMAPDHQRYYRRVQERFIPMRHYEVEEMMRLKDSPQLELILVFKNGGSIAGREKGYIAFGVKNTSNATAKFPFVTVRRISDGPKIAQYGLDGNGNNLWKRLLLDEPNTTIYMAGNEMVVHPSQKFLVSKFEFLEAPIQELDYWSIDRLRSDEKVEIEFEIGCEDMRKRSYRYVFTRNHFYDRTAPEPIVTSG